MGIPAENQILIYRNKVMQENESLDFGGASDTPTIICQIVEQRPTPVESPIKVQVKFKPLSTRMSIEVDLEKDTLDKIQTAIFDRFGVPPCRQRLIIGGNDLPDDPDIQIRDIPVFVAEILKCKLLGECVITCALR